MDVVEPWASDTLPYGITPEHLRVAAQVWVEHDDQRVGDSRVCVMQGAWGKPLRVYGGIYPDTDRRRQRLTGIPAMFGRSHPAILVPDPSPTENPEVVPVGLVTVVGYVGSAWSGLTTDWAKRVRRDIVGEFPKYWTTVVTFDAAGEMTVYITKRDVYRPTG